MLYDYNENYSTSSLELFENLKNIYNANKTNKSLMTSTENGERIISNEERYSSILLKSEKHLNDFQSNLNAYIENSNKKNYKNKNKYLNAFLQDYENYENSLKEINTNEIFIASDAKFENKYKLNIINDGISVNLNIKSFIDELNRIKTSTLKPADSQNKIRSVLRDYNITSLDENNLLKNNLNVIPANKNILRTELIINNPETNKVLTENSYSFFRDFTLSNISKDNQFKENKKIETVKKVIEQFNFLNDDLLEDEEFKKKFKSLEATSYNEMNAAILENSHNLEKLINEHPEKLKMTFNYLLRHHDTVNLREFLISVKNIDNNGIHMEQLKNQLDNLSPISYIIKEFSKDYETKNEEELEFGKKQLGEICGEYEKIYEEIKSADIKNLLEKDHINPALFGDVIKHLNWSELTHKEKGGQSLAEYIISISVGKDSKNFERDNINLLKNLVQHPEFDMEQEFEIETSKNSNHSEKLRGSFNLPDYLSKSKNSIIIQMMDHSDGEEMNDFLNDAKKQEVINTIQDASKLGGKTGKFAKDLILAKQNMIEKHDKFHLTWIEKTFCSCIALFHALEVAICKRQEKRLVKELIQKTVDKDGNRILNNAKINYDNKTGNVIIEAIYKNDRTGWKKVGSIDPSGVFSDVRLSKEHQEQFKLKNEHSEKLSQGLVNLKKGKEGFVEVLENFVLSQTKVFSKNIEAEPVKKQFKPKNKSKYEMER